jgi:serine/threonine-protein kinase HipA
VDIRPRVLATAIDLEDSNASPGLALNVAPYFKLEDAEARKIASEVGKAVSGWRKEAARTGLASGQIDRMASASEHDDLRTALDL